MANIIRTIVQAGFKSTDLNDDGVDLEHPASPGKGGVRSPMSPSSPKSPVFNHEEFSSLSITTARSVKSENPKVLLVVRNAFRLFSYKNMLQRVGCNEVDIFVTLREASRKFLSTPTFEVPIYNLILLEDGKLHDASMSLKDFCHIVRHQERMSEAKTGKIVRHTLIGIIGSEPPMRSMLSLGMDHCFRRPFVVHLDSLRRILLPPLIAVKGRANVNRAASNFAEIEKIMKQLASTGPEKKEDSFVVKRLREELKSCMQLLNEAQDEAREAKSEVRYLKHQQNQHKTTFAAPDSPQGAIDTTVLLERLRETTKEAKYLRRMYELQREELMHALKVGDNSNAQILLSRMVEREELMSLKAKLDAEQTASQMLKTDLEKTVQAYVVVNTKKFFERSMQTDAEEKIIYSKKDIMKLLLETPCELEKTASIGESLLHKLHRAIIMLKLNKMVAHPSTNSTRLEVLMDDVIFSLEAELDRQKQAEEKNAGEGGVAGGIVFGNSLVVRLEEELKKLTATLAETEKAKKVLVEEHKRELEYVIVEMNESEKSLQQSRRDRDVLNGNISSLQAEVEKWKKELDEEKQMNGLNQEQMLELKNRLEDRERTIQKLNQRLLEVRDSEVRMNKEKESRQKENQQVQQSFDQKLATLQSDNESLTKQIATLTDELASRDNDLKRQQQETENMRKELDKVSKEDSSRIKTPPLISDTGTDDLKTDASTSNPENNAKIEGFLKEIKDLRRFNSMMMKNKDEMAFELDVIQRKMAELTQALEERTVERNEAQEAYEQEKLKCADLNKEKEVLINKSNRKTQAHQYHLEQSLAAAQKPQVPVKDEFVQTERERGVRKMMYAESQRRTSEARITTNKSSTPLEPNIPPTSTHMAVTNPGEDRDHHDDHPYDYSQSSDEDEHSRSLDISARKEEAAKSYYASLEKHMKKAQKTEEPSVVINVVKGEDNSAEVNALIDENEQLKKAVIHYKERVQAQKSQMMDMRGGRTKTEYLVGGVTKTEVMLDTIAITELRERTQKLLLLAQDAIEMPFETTKVDTLSDVIEAHDRIAKQLMSNLASATERGAKAQKHFAMACRENDRLMEELKGLSGEVRSQSPIGVVDTREAKCQAHLASDNLDFVLMEELYTNAPMKDPDHANHNKPSHYHHAHPKRLPLQKSSITHYSIQPDYSKSDILYTQFDLICSSPPVHIPIIGYDRFPLFSIDMEPPPPKPKLKLTRENAVQTQMKKLHQSTQFEEMLCPLTNAPPQQSLDSSFLSRAVELQALVVRACRQLKRHFQLNELNVDELDDLVDKEDAHGLMTCSILLLQSIAQFFTSYEEITHMRTKETFKAVTTNRKLATVNQMIVEVEELVKKREVEQILASDPSLKALSDPSTLKPIVSPKASQPLNPTFSMTGKKMKMSQQTEDRQAVKENPQNQQHPQQQPKSLPDVPVVSSPTAANNRHKDTTSPPPRSIGEPVLSPSLSFLERPLEGPYRKVLQQEKEAIEEIAKSPGIAPSENTGEIPSTLVLPERVTSTPIGGRRREESSTPDGRAREKVVIVRRPLLPEVQEIVATPYFEMWKQNSAPEAGDVSTVKPNPDIKGLAATQGRPPVYGKHSFENESIQSKRNREDLLKREIFRTSTSAAAQEAKPKEVVATHTKVSRLTMTLPKGLQSLALPRQPQHVQKLQARNSIMIPDEHVDTEGLATSPSKWENLQPDTAREVLTFLRKQQEVLHTQLMDSKNMRLNMQLDYLKARFEARVAPEVAEVLLHRPLLLKDKERRDVPPPQSDWETPLAVKMAIKDKNGNEVVTPSPVRFGGKVFVKRTTTQPLNILGPLEGTLCGTLKPKHQNPPHGKGESASAEKLPPIHKRRQSGK